MNVNKLWILYGIIACTALWLSGCAQQSAVTREKEAPPAPEQQVKAPPAASYLKHTIRWKGETLIRISRWYTGSGRNWLKIAEVNKALDPNRLKIGDTVLIPEELVQTREPMPAEYRVPASRDRKKEAPKAAVEEAVPETLPEVMPEEEQQVVPEPPVAPQPAVEEGVPETLPEMVPEQELQQAVPESPDAPQPAVEEGVLETMPESTLEPSPQETVPAVPEEVELFGPIEESDVVAPGEEDGMFPALETLE